jgi:hypothetical protein
MLRKENGCCRSQRSENRMTDLSESSKEGCGSKMAVLPMMMMMMMIIILLLLLLLLLLFC